MVSLAPNGMLGKPGTFGRIQSLFFQAISSRKYLQIDILFRQTRTSHPLSPEH